MTPDTEVRLGDFVFRGLEIPEQLDFGGDQSLVVHELVGGGRVVDAMGHSEAPIEWSGLFFGKDALERATYLDFLRADGRPLDLTWGGISRTVVIKSFKCSFQRFYQLPYNISCLVVDGASRYVKLETKSEADPNRTIETDLGIVNHTKPAQLTGVAAIAERLTVAKDKIESARKPISDFAKATQAQIDAIVTPIKEFQAEVTALIASTQNTLMNMTTVGGLLPGNPVSANVAKMGSAAVSFNSAWQLHRINYTLTRTQKNISLLSTPSNIKKINVVGGNLYRVAQEEYGDATHWTTIAKANNLTDPQIVGMKTLVIPPKDSNATGGILA